MRIASVTPEYTGGGIYVFTGSLDDGTFFIAESLDGSVRIIDVNPDDYDADEEVYMEEWQQAHLIKDIENSEHGYEATSFLDQVYEWIITNKPKGNYSMKEIYVLKNDLTYSKNNR